MERVDNLVLFLILVEFLCVSVQLMLAVGLLYVVFIVLRYVTWISDLSKPFIMKEYWILSKTFSASNEMIMFFVCLFFLSVCLYGGLYLLVFMC